MNAAAGASPPADCASCPLRQLAGERGPTQHEYPAGETLFEQGDVARHLTQVDVGLILESASNVQGDEVQCAIRGPGSTLGLEGLAGQRNRTTAVSLTPVVACRVPAQQVLDGIDDCAPCSALVRLALEESDFWRSRQQVARGSAAVQVGRLLLSLSRHCDGALPQLPRGLLARAARIRPETLSRALSRLRSKGLIGDGHELRIVDLPALSRFVSES